MSCDCLIFVRTNMCLTHLPSSLREAERGSDAALDEGASRSWPVRLLIYRLCGAVSDVRSWLVRRLSR
jgi:hypothetical protein